MKMNELADSLAEATLRVRPPARVGLRLGQRAGGGRIRRRSGSATPASGHSTLYERGEDGGGSEGAHRRRRTLPRFHIDGLLAR